MHCKAPEGLLFWCSGCWVWLRARSGTWRNKAVNQGGKSSIVLLCPWALQLLPPSFSVQLPPTSGVQPRAAVGSATCLASHVPRVQQYPNTRIFLSFLESSSVFSHFLGVCICSYCFKSPPRWTKTPLQYSLHEPSLFLCLLLLVLISTSLTDFAGCL